MLALWAACAVWRAWLGTVWSSCQGSTSSCQGSTSSCQVTLLRLLQESGQRPVVYYEISAAPTLALSKNPANDMSVECGGVSIGEVRRSGVEWVAVKWIGSECGGVKCAGVRRGNYTGADELTLVVVGRRAPGQRGFEK
jgi:hypothetical protein